MNKRTWEKIRHGINSENLHELMEADKALQDYVGLKDYTNTSIHTSLRRECSFNMRQWTVSSFLLMKELFSETCPYEVQKEIAKVLWCRLFVFDCYHQNSEDVDDVRTYPPQELRMIASGFDPDKSHQDNLEKENFNGQRNMDTCFGGVCHS